VHHSKKLAAVQYRAFLTNRRWFEDYEEQEQEQGPQEEEEEEEEEEDTEKAENDEKKKKTNKTTKPMTLSSTEPDRTKNEKERGWEIERRSRNDREMIERRSRGDQEGRGLGEGHEEERMLLLATSAVPGALPRAVAAWERSNFIEGGGGGGGLPWASCSSCATTAIDGG
jgi:hypothetical protein